MRRDYDESDYEKHLALINYVKKTWWKGALLGFALAAAVHQGCKYYKDSQNESVEERRQMKINKKDSGLIKVVNE